jgi:hypothetical protein
MPFSPYYSCIFTLVITHYIFTSSSDVLQCEYFLDIMIRSLCWILFESPSPRLHYYVISIHLRRPVVEGLKESVERCDTKNFRAYQTLI